ncbi:MAG: pilus assembly FimT family protein [Gemmatimonadales bacterium]
MRHGVSLPELAASLALIGLVLALAGPKLAGALDRIAVRRAAAEVTTAIAVTRHRAIAQGSRTRLVIRHDSLYVDSLGVPGWGRWRAFPGPAAHGVGLSVSNPVITFSPSGIAWGFSNTKVVLRRGSHSETITTSRVGRVKRW